MTFISYAQNFEDVMLWRALSHIKTGFYIDIGAQDPIVDSVSLAFYERGWRGINVEPTAHYSELLRKHRPRDVILQAAVGDTQAVGRFFEISQTGISTADSLIAKRHQESGFDVKEICVPFVPLEAVFDLAGNRDVHWLKVDVEGFESQVLSSWGSCPVSPWIVVIECTLPLTKIETHESWEGMLTSRGYTRAYMDGLNAYYVSEEHPELKSAFRVPPNVFDEFMLSGTANASFHRLLEERLKEEQARSARIIVDKDVEISKLELQVGSASEAASSAQKALAARAEAFADELSNAHSAFRDLARRFAEQQRELVNQRAAFHLEVAHIRDESATRERELSARLVDAEFRAAREMSELHDRIEELMRVSSERERVHSAEMHAIHSATALEMRTLQSAHSKRERALIDHIESIRASLSWRLTKPLRLFGEFQRDRTADHEPPPTAVEREKGTSAGQIGAFVQPKPAEGMAKVASARRSNRLIGAAQDLPGLLSLDHEEFVECAYLTILNRAADPGGLSHYVSQLRAGHPKISVLSALYGSDEARSARICIPWMSGAILRHNIARFPLIRVAFRLLGNRGG
jgi:FkbM family methyltransferase